MASGDIGLVRELIELQAPLRSLPIAERRRQYDRAEQAFGRGEQPGEVVDANGCPAEWVRPHREPSQPVVLYMHGGGYSLGSTRSHRHLAAAVGQAAGAAVLSIDYRRAPECPFPAAVQDATAATRWLLARTGAPVILAGDSAGGGLVLATLISLRDAGERPPTAAVCLSPWLDLTCTADALTRVADRDPLLSRTELERMAGAYLQGADPRQSLASPAFAELTGLPPLLIQVGSDEILLDDARSLAEQARAHEVHVKLEEWPDMIHVWQWYFPVLQEGREAIEAIARFINRHASSRASHRSRPATRTAPASLTQQAHLLIAPETAGRGFLSWVYQLNGPLDHQALTRAIDDVVERHEILRVRFEQHNDRLYQVVTPFKPRVLQQVDLSHQTKRQGLQTAVEDATSTYNSLSPSHDPRFRAAIYRLDRKTSVLAMFVAEVLVDSDSGSLLTAEISRAYAHYAGTAPPVGMPRVSCASYLDYIELHPPDRAAIMHSSEYWQAQDTAIHIDWPVCSESWEVGGATVSFGLAPQEWNAVAMSAQQLGLTQYVLVLTSVQVALAYVTQPARFLVHAIVPQRAPAADGIIGNFHSIARIAAQTDLAASFSDMAVSTATAVAEAIEHSVFPAPLAVHARPSSGRSSSYLPHVRFYMFASHGGPLFEGARRRRFRLHGLPHALLSVSCIYAQEGRQDFVFFSAVIPEAPLRQLATRTRAALDADQVRPDAEASRAAHARNAGVQATARQHCHSVSTSPSAVGNVLAQLDGARLASN